ncbi:MAG TPA: hypothetical protein PKK23_21355 [Nitrospirales bacterium]|nr:hypothetical protein [Nitrospiraceae bacterium]HNP31608.1 hypothetical protein [Nitrospirales bacterium]
MTDSPISESNSLIVSRKIFEGTRYEATDEDIRDLSRNIILLEQRGLTELNRRLIECRTSVWDTLVEHNFAVSMVSVFDPSVSISYEPTEGLQRPPDFKITKNAITYWIQIKNLSRLERENRQAKIIEEIERQISAIKVSKLLGCNLAEDFSRNDIPALIAYISNVANTAPEGEEFIFGNETSPKAKLEFWLPNRKSLSHLSLGVSGDIDMVDQTGLAKEQIKQSVRNATGAFDWCANEKTINLVAMDSESQKDIDICEALFGTEFERLRAGHHSWKRKPDGLFEEHPFNERLVGLIALRRKNKGVPISKYRMLFFLNESFLNCKENITSLFSFDQIIRKYMRPPMGSANFGN